MFKGPIHPVGTPYDVGAPPCIMYPKSISSAFEVLTVHVAGVLALATAGRAPLESKGLFVLAPLIAKYAGLQALPLV